MKGRRVNGREEPGYIVRSGGEGTPCLKGHAKPQGVIHRSSVYFASLDTT